MNPGFLEAVRRYHLRTASPKDAAELEETYGLQKFGAGYNNVIYTFADHDRRTHCLKCYKVDDRRRAEREWAALTLAKTASAILTPEPIAFSPDALVPIVIMTLVPGTPMSDLHPLRPEQLRAVAEAMRTVYRELSPRDSDIFAMPDDVAKRISGLSRQWETVSPNESDMAREAHALWLRWLNGRDRDLLQNTPAPQAPIFSQGDSSLANRLWNENGAVFLVDWEYAGWTDRVTDAAAVASHTDAAQTPASDWETHFTATFGFSDDERLRYNALCRFNAVAWVCKLWPSSPKATPRFAAQIERTMHIMDEA